VRALFSLIALAIVVALALTLGAENGLYVKFNYLIAQDEFRLSSLMVAWFFAGFIVCALLCSWGLIRSRIRIGQLKKKVAMLGAECERHEAAGIAAELSVKN
jgi:lipopolysaccharide assembly protein A